MLAYAFRVLDEGNYADLSSESFENTLELFTAILTNGISNQVKRGLGKEYVYINEISAMPRGKINVTESIRCQTMVSNRLSCNYDELTKDVKMNQILKSTALLLLRSEEVSLQRKRELKKVIIYFDSVEQISLLQIDWVHIQYNRNNGTYKMLINICYLIVSGLLLSENKGNIRVRKLFDNQKMHTLYEHFVLEYFKKHYPQLKPSAPHIKWNTDDKIIQFLPVMRTDITLIYEEKKFIIDTKYYQNSMHRIEMYDSQTVHSNNIYQIFTYVKNSDIENNGNVSGMLLYAKTESGMSPDFTYQMSGNTIWVKTLDLNTNFSEICGQLDNIISMWLQGEQVERVE